MKQLKIKDLNYHDRMDLVMAILNTTTVAHHHLEQTHPIRVALSDAWMHAYDARQLFKKEMGPEHYVGTASIINAFEVYDDA